MSVIEVYDIYFVGNFRHLTTIKTLIFKLQGHNLSYTIFPAINELCVP
jgi:hypothetical protein